MQLLKAFFGAVGVDPGIEPPFHGDSGDKIFIGDGFFMNLGGIILDAAEVRIGANVVCGPNVHLGAISHPIDPVLPLSVDESMALGVPFTIRDPVSYGDGTLISAGVRIGDKNSSPVGSMVIQDIPSNVIAAGHPCKVIRMLPSRECFSMPRKCAGETT